MKTELEQQDIQLIAEKVAELLRPLLSNNTRYEDDVVFDVQSLAEYLKVDISWIRKQVSYRTIPYFKLGKYVRFKQSVIDKWIKTQTSEPISPHKIPNKMKAAS